MKTIRNILLVGYVIVVTGMFATWHYMDSDDWKSANIRSVKHRIEKEVKDWKKGKETRNAIREKKTTMKSFVLL